MQNALLVGLSRQVALRREMDVVANNIANLNTAGFKSQGALFEEFIPQKARTGGEAGGNKVSFVRDRATWLDMSQGTIERTGNPLDVAVDGKGFLVVQTPRGERYTRNGAMQINGNGELVTSEGHQVLGDSGPIILQPTDRDIMVNANGIISVRAGNAMVESQRGKLRLAAFDQPTQLQKDGAGTFLAPDTMVPQPDTASRIVQGSIERSNVRSVIEMTRMIEVTRSYTQVATLLSQQADLNRTAIEKLAEVPN
ncbi:MAG: flagellar basal-body rod protein FlgF [Pseudolabrys sp.]